MGPIARQVPTDLLRVRTNLDLLQDATSRPEGIIFGNSVGMNGLDAKQLSGALPGEPLVYNLCSTGQTLAESYLYFQELPDSVSFVVVLMLPAALEKVPEVRENTINAFHVYGYRPSDGTIESLERALDGSVDTLRRNGAWHRFHSRWMLRQWPDTTVRRLARSDLDLQRAHHDKFYPAPYTRVVEERKVARLLSRAKQPRDRDGFRMSDAARRLLAAMASDAERHGCRLFLVLAPVRPELQEHFGEPFFEGVRAFGENPGLPPSLRVIDATHLLRREHFVDHVHPTREGAGMLGDLVAAAIR